MIFSEVYSVYYKAVSRLIEKAIDGELNANNMKEMIEAQAFSESYIYISENIRSENWSLISKDFRTPIKAYPPQLMTTLEKRFLKTISIDPRFRLFQDMELPELEDVSPLYDKNDFYYFDQFKDGDPYEDVSYRLNFKKIMEGLRGNKLLEIVYRGGKGVLQKGTFTPRKLEYSEKDDKFRLLCMGQYSLATINIARIKTVKVAGVYSENSIKKFERNTRTITMEIINQRNALERAMLHFSHFEKTSRKIDDLHYEMKLTYYTSDETEVLIRVLSFGPMIKVTAPDGFVALIKERLYNQKSCE